MLLSGSSCNSLLREGESSVFFSAPLDHALFFFHVRFLHRSCKKFHRKIGVFLDLMFTAAFVEAKCEMNGQLWNFGLLVTAKAKSS